MKPPNKPKLREFNKRYVEIILNYFTVLVKAQEAEESYARTKKEMEEAAEIRAREAEERAVREAEEREIEMERLREQMARDRDEENRQTEADRNRELQEQLKVI